jgi:signal transduction histidine kinase
MHLRRRLNTVLLQWFLLLVVFAGAVWAISLPGIRRDLVDERVLLARTIAHSIDTTIATSLQSLGRLSADVPLDAGAASATLRPFLFESPFSEAISIVDSTGRVLAGDPAGVAPIDRAWLGDHELVTPAVHRSDAENDRLRVVMVQPFRRDDQQYFLVAEMDPAASRLTTFLKDLQPAEAMRVDIVDAHGVIVASADPTQVLRTVPDQPATDALVVRAPLRYAPWNVVIQQRNAEAFSGLHMASRGLLFTGIALAITGVLLARTLSRSIVGPIRQLSRQAEVMRTGDLTTPIAVKGDHEISVLAKTLDDARARLASTLDELQAFNQRLEEQVAARTRVIVQQDEQRKVLLRRMLGATEDERRRLARELHDEIAQLLTVIQLSLHKTGVQSPDMDRANQLLVKTQQEIHRIIHDLRPALLDDLGLPTAMKSYADDNLRRQGLSVSLDIDDHLPSRPEIETVIFRIYQELVTNILRHAHAENVSAELYQSDGTLVLDVEDDGDGFDPETKSGSAGLTGMRERAALVNGIMTVDSEAGQGTHVRVEIPLQ